MPNRCSRLPHGSPYRLHLLYEPSEQMCSVCFVLGVRYGHKPYNRMPKQLNVVILRAYSQQELAKCNTINPLPHQKFWPV